MNINTGTLLSMLQPKLTNAAKEKIEKASSDGKVNLGEIIKDQSVRTVLNSLLHDISTGTKSKENVLHLLENSKHSLSFKNFSSDIKLLLQNIENTPELQKNPKLLNQITLLKNSMIDLSKVDSKTIMNSLTNSGIFLESKLLQQSIPISDVVKKAVEILSKALEFFQSDKPLTLPTQLSRQVDLLLMNQEIPKDIKLEVKLAVSNLLNEFNRGVTSPIPLKLDRIENLAQLSTQMKQPLDAIITMLNKELPASEPKTNLINNLQSLFTNLKTFTPKEITAQLTTILQQTHNLFNVSLTPSNSNVPKDIQMEIKSAIANLLRPMQSVPQLIQNFQQNVTSLNHTLTQNFPNTTLSKTVAPMLQELLTTFKDSFTVKENLPIVKTIFSTLTQKVDVSTIDEGMKTNLKSQLQNLSSQLQTLDTLKAPEQKGQLLQSVFENLKSFSSKLETVFSQIAANKVETMPKNLANDLKGIILQIQDQIENAKEPVNREMRALVDKVATQVEFFQLMSYSSNTSHTFIAFLQDNFEDADMKFHKTDQDTFSCQINLNLKEHGELKVLLVLDKEHNLGINIGVESGEFKEKVQENLPKLRSQINSVGLLLQALNIFNINNEQISGSKELKGYGDDDNLSFGVDIQA